MNRCNLLKKIADRVLFKALVILVRAKEFFFLKNAEFKGNAEKITKKMVSIVLSDIVTGIEI